MLRPGEWGFCFLLSPKIPGASRTPTATLSHNLLSHPRVSAALPLAGCTSGSSQPPANGHPHGPGCRTTGKARLPEICYPYASTHTRQMLDSPGTLPSGVGQPYTLGCVPLYPQPSTQRSPKPVSFPKAPSFQIKQRTSCL